MVMRQNSFFLQGMLNFFEDCLDLPGTLAATDNKIVGKTTYLSGIQQDNITCLLITGSFYRFIR